MFSNREIASLVARQMDLPRDKVLETIQRFQAHVIAEIARGNALRLHEFGSFRIHQPPPRRFQVGLFRKKWKEVAMPPRLRFRFSPTFKQRVEAVQTPLQHPPRPPRAPKKRSMWGR